MAHALSAYATERILVVGSEEHFPPFSIGNTDETASGYTVDLWKEVAKEMGLKYSIRVRPWGQILQEFKEGKIDVLLNIAQSKDRNLYADFSVRHVTVHGAIFVRTDESRIHSEADLADKSIIVFKSDSAHEYAISRGWEKQLVIVNTAQDGITLLASGQCDAMLLGKLSGIQVLRSLNITNIMALDVEAGYAQKFSFGVQEGDSELLSHINEGLALTKANGTYDDIYEKWFALYEAKEPTIRDMLPYIGSILFIALIISIYNFRKRRTERELTNKQLKSLSQRLQLATSSARLGVWDWNIRENRMFWDDRMFELYGITRETFPDGVDAWMNGLHPEDKETAIAVCQAALTGAGEFDTVFRICRPDGSVKYIKANGIVVRGNDGTADRMIGINMDITEQKQAEEEKLALEQQYHQAQKLESLGILAGGIAHDFNNIMTIIIGYCSLARLDSDAGHNSIPEIEKAADRAANLCRQMLAYAGKTQSFQTTDVNVWMVVNEMLNMLKQTLGKNIKIKTDLSATTSIITGDASQISQIVMNLILNASEAIGEKQGEILVSLSRRVIATGESEKDYLGKLISTGRYICLEVTDNGCGMDDETTKRIFEPFYTTKFVGRGLGMSAVLGIITSHGGVLQLFSQQGKGTTFKIFLPIHDGESSGDESLSEQVPTFWQGSGTLLLVDDEEQVRSIAKRMLKKMGFAVVEASNGKEALDLYEKHIADITIVVTDMDMPEMNGNDLIPALKKINAGLPIIISSGLGDVDTTSLMDCENGAVGIVGKPYNFEQLQNVVKSAVEPCASTF